MNALQTIKKAFKLESLVGDIRSAAVGAICGAVTSMILTWFFTSPTKEFSILVNDSGFAQPRGLFEYVEQQDPSLKLVFQPANFKDVYVCEYKLTEAETWRRLLFKYIDAYRDCFDVKAKAENEFIIAANFRTSVLKQVDSTFLCKCLN